VGVRVGWTPVGGEKDTLFVSGRGGGTAHQHTTGETLLAKAKCRAFKSEGRVCTHDQSSVSLSGRVDAPNTPVPNKASRVKGSS
jgi:hypothetical protein